MIQFPVVLVCGGRGYYDRSWLEYVLDHYRRETVDFLRVIHGAARGADTLASEWAKARRIPVIPYPADWNAGNRAGHLRNAKMLAEGRPDVVIAFPGGNGTANMIRQAERAGVPVVKVPA